MGYPLIFLCKSFKDNFCIIYAKITLSKRFANLKTKPRLEFEEGVITGGFGDGVSSWLLENDFQGQIKRLGLPDSFIQHGKRDELLDEIGLDENSIINTIKSIFVNTSNDILIES